MTKRFMKPALLLAAVVVGVVSHGGAPILLKAKTIVPEKEAVRMRLTSTSSTGGQAETLPERGLYIVQHDGIIQPSWRESLETAGAIIRSYIPENAYLVEASPAVHETIRTTIPHAYLGEYKGEYRYDASSIASLQGGTRTTSSGSGVSSPTKEFSILIFTEECRDEIAAKIGKLAGCSVSGADGKVIRAVLTAVAVKEVASWPDVNWVEVHLPTFIDNNYAVAPERMNVKTVWPSGTSGLGLSGEGQIVGVADSGLDTGVENTLHRDIKGRLVKAIAYGRQNDWSDLNGHGTHVVGSVMGDGTESSGEVKGIAYKAKLVMQSMGGDSSGSLSTPEIQTLFNAAYSSGARIHSNSWSSQDPTRAIYGSYTGADSSQIDDYLFKHPDMVVLFSTGNEGVDLNKDGVVDSDSLSPQSSSKNCISVGNAENFNGNSNRVK